MKCVKKVGVKMYKKYVKRVLDIFFALILIVVLSPVMLIIALLVKLDSKGPVLFKQVRSGKNNKEFLLYKFRSMTCDNDFYDSTKEDRLTKVGRVIRKTSLDELPQMFNILKGEMSFIGPRPWVVDYAYYFNDYQKRRLEVLPGITGLAQCSGRNDLNILDRIKLDVDYVDNLTFKLDVIIFFKTIKCLIKREGFSNSKSEIYEELKTLKAQNNKKCSFCQNKIEKQQKSSRKQKKEAIIS